MEEGERDQPTSHILIHLYTNIKTSISTREALPTEYYTVPALYGYLWKRKTVCVRLTKNVTRGQWSTGMNSERNRKIRRSGTIFVRQKFEKKPSILGVLLWGCKLRDVQRVEAFWVFSACFSVCFWLVQHKVINFCIKIISANTQLLARRAMFSQQVSFWTIFFKHLNVYARVLTCFFPISTASSLKIPTEKCHVKKYRFLTTKTHVFFISKAITSFASLWPPFLQCFPWLQCR